MHASQADLFERPSALPAGFRYQAELISKDEEHNLVESIAGLPLKEFEFQGFLGKRRMVSFGWRYDFNGGGLQRTDDIPGFLMPVQPKAAAFAGLQPADLQQVLLTEYRPGVQIGWHKDRSVFGEVVGISLLSLCTFRLRRKTDHGWERASMIAEPRSAYLTAGTIAFGVGAQHSGGRGPALLDHVSEFQSRLRVRSCMPRKQRNARSNA